MKRLFATLTIIFICSLAAVAQIDRRVQNRPYIDLRPMHFGILVGLNMQDIEFENVGPQTITYEDGSVHEELILCDADKWNLTYDTPITEDVLGYQTDADVDDVMRRVQELEPVQH